MTSRTPMGVPQRQPQQRSLSSSTLSAAQRPVPPHRSVSQHHGPYQQSSSPTSRQQPQQQPPPQQPSDAASASAADPIAESSSPGTAAGRHGGANTPRRGGSRLRLELSSDHVLPAASQLSATGVADSPQSLPSARALSAIDGLDGGANSPALSRASHHDAPAENNPPIPMPDRRRIKASRRPASAAPAAPAPITPAASLQASVKKDGRPKPYTVEIPPEAPRLATSGRPSLIGADQFGKGYSSGHADFFPWTGKHREDDWSSESISKGIWERYSTTEASSARAAILPALKQKSGLSALSTIFMGVLNQRRQRGQVSAPSTFKPPPRVTLTDTKREIWLRDLANPATPLRRLSRTIPHGIRGRALLDQCLSKNVPTERAVWLAKCVGANEIRAFKRKGPSAGGSVGGDVRWIKDWTMFVEQFVDSVVSAPDESGWKAKVTYAIRLATSLYSEHLVARDHYLDWIISGLETSSQARLPMWMLISQIYWPDLLRFRKYGVRIVSALLNHMHTIQHDPDRDIFSELAGQLAAMLSGLAKSNPESFVLPNVWPDYRDSLKTALLADDEGSHRAYDSINSRNMRVASAETSYPPAGRQKLVKLLDSTLPNSMDPELAAKAWATTDNKAQLVRTLVEWATSMHRSGVARVYVVTTLLKTFGSWSPFQNFDATTQVLGILDDVSPRDQKRKGLVYHFVSELIRCGLFSVPRYLQWLISRGGLHDASDIDSDDGPCATRLIVELPVDSFPASLKADRANLLRRAGNYSIASEEEDMLVAVRCVQHTLGLQLPEGDPLAQRKPMPLRKLLARIRSSSKALKCAVSSYIRGVAIQDEHMCGDGHAPGGSNPALLNLFVSARAILETTEDFVTLSEVIQSCLKSSDAELLATCADTVNANLAVFAAIGSAGDCLGMLTEQLKALGQGQGQQTPHTLLAAVALLAQRMPGHEEMAAHLRQELLQSDRSNALDACSPVSDSMALQAQSGEGELSDEIDRLLASGTRIDHPTMNRLFRTVLPRLEAGWAKGDDNSRRVFASLLTKMRVFDAHHFDKLMSDWVSHVRSMPTRPPLAQLFPLLVIVGCLTVPALLHTANASPPTVPVGAAAEGSAIYLQELLELLLVRLPQTQLSKSTGLSRDEVYRFGIHQDAARSDNVPALLGLIRNAITEYSMLQDHGAGSGAKLALDDASLRDHVLDALRLLVVTDPPAASEALSIKDLPAGATDLVSTVTARLLLPDGDDSAISFDRILGLATELTLPFCQIKLEFDLSVTESRTTTTTQQPPQQQEQPAPSRFDLFSSAMDRAIEANNITWTSMLSCLSGDISQHLRSLAHARFLGLIPSPARPNDLASATGKDQIHLAENLVDVVEAMSTGHSGGPAQLPGELVDKLSDLCEILSSTHSNNASQMLDVRTAVIDHWLPALLRLVTTHGATASVSGASGLETRARVVVALCALLLELQGVSDPAGADLAERVFDVAMLLVDGLPDEARLQCARAVLALPGSHGAGASGISVASGATACGANASSASASAGSLSADPRLHYLLGTAPAQTTRADRLVLVRREPGTGPGGKTASGLPPRSLGSMYGIGPPLPERYSPFVLRQWEMLSESTPIAGENDASLSLGLFEAIRIQ